MVPAVAAASPMKYDQCDIQVQEPANSAGYYLSQDCKQLYVLPPKFGRMQISGYRPTGDLEYRCRAIKSMGSEYADFHLITEVYTGEAARNAEKIAEYKEALETGLFPVGMDRKKILANIKELVKVSGEMRKEVVEFNKYNELVNDFQKKNPDLNVRRLQPDINMLSIVDKSANSEVQKTEMSAILDLTIPGQPLPMSQSVANLLSDEPVELTQVDLQKDIFGAALSGRVRLSDIGACATNEAGISSSDFDIEELKDYAQANAFFQYQVQVKRNYHVTYNLSELYRRIHEQSKSGGFFSRKTLNKLITEEKQDSWITFHSESEDARFEYTPEDIKEIKKEFLDRALKQVVAFKTGKPEAALALIDPSGKNGAQAIGDELQKCPHLYCQIGAAGFKVLDAIFGSEKATAELVKTFNSKQSETETSIRSVQQFGSMSFK